MAKSKLELRTEHAEGRTIMHVGGEFDLEVASQMRAALHSLIEQADSRVTLDLRQLKYIDSTGIGILISLIKALHARGVSFDVVHIPPHIRKLFDMTGITPFLMKPESSI
ncbi:STAS domain-containing protein [Cohnella cellulosilytica]|uniref:Anti-sigma factor antagonist n=1 Tax=Cohnella cellulosilytica TaxID=986710 RepID=A0ABW2F7P5_9BACL